MPEAAPASARSPALFTIAVHRPFADALAAGLIAGAAGDPLALARGRILLPNNRAVRSVTEAFVRRSGGGLLLPRLIAIGDPEIDERIGGALDPADLAGPPIPPAVEPLQRLLALARLVAAQSGAEQGSAEALRLALELARTIDALLIEEIDPQRLAGAVDDAPELAVHWQLSLERLRLLLDQWPAELARLGRIDLADRRNRLLRALAARWAGSPPPAFTVAAGITSAAPAIALLLARVAAMPGGAVVLPGVAPPAVMSDAEWDALGPDEAGRGEPSHPQYHLKLLLDRMGFARGEIEPWRGAGGTGAPAVRGRTAANAMTAADFSDKWNGLPPAERRLSGVRSALLANPAAEAQGIAIAIREALETPGRTAALVTPDRGLAMRVSALLARWGIAADDSAGRPLSNTPPGTLLLAIAAAAAERLAPVPLLALLKHPLVRSGGQRLDWLDSVRLLDLALRGPRPPAGLGPLDALLSASEAVDSAWRQVRVEVAPLDGLLAAPITLEQFAAGLRQAASALTGDAAWQGPAGRLAGELLAELEQSPAAAAMLVEAEDAVQLLRQLLDQRVVRPAYGNHPRIAIWGLLEARLQQADLMVLGGLNEGVWPALAAPDPWLAPRIRQSLGLAGADFRIGLAAHDFVSALGARDVLLTRARRDSRSPTVPSRLWMRLMAMTGGLARDLRLEHLAGAIDDPGDFTPAGRPAPAPPAADRPRRISVTAVDRLSADPFAFYAAQILGLRALDPVDADHSAAWKGSAVHAVLEQWLKLDGCDPDALLARARRLVADQAIHPMLRALWQPRLIEAIEWIASMERDNRAAGRRPLAAEVRGEARLSGVILHGKADRIDREADGGLVILDYKTGKAPSNAAVEAGFALQLGLLGLIARAGGFEQIAGEPVAHEYWSLAKNGDQFGKCSRPGGKEGAAAFLARAERNFAAAAARWLTGEGEFTAKLHPAFAPWGDYDQLMRLEEWYGRQ